MKKQLLMLAALGSLVQAQAQSQHVTDQKARLKANRAMVNKLLKAQDYGNGTAAKPTVIQHRVKSQVMMSDFSSKDSTTFSYSGTRNSTFNYDYEEYAYNSYFEPYYAPMPNIPHYGNTLDMLADTIKLYEDGILMNIETATYRPDNKITYSSSITPPITTPSYGIYNVYNAAGYISTIYNISDGDTLDKRNIVYNAAHTQVITDTLYNKVGSNYELETISKYYYNTQNKIDSMVMYNFVAPAVLEAIDKVSFDYYGDGKLRQVVYGELGSGFPFVDSFGYTLGINYITLRDLKVKIVFGVDTIDYREREIKYPGTDGLPDSAKQFRYNEILGTWEEQQNAVYAYTSFNEPDSIYFYVNGELSSLNKFYYEEYDDGTTSTKNIINNSQFKAYPNPFHNDIMIDWKGTLSNEKVIVKMVNILGQEVFKKSMIMNSGVNEIQLPDVNAGNYILIIQDAKGKSYQDKLIKK